MVTKEFVGEMMLISCLVMRNAVKYGKYGPGDWRRCDSSGSVLR